jgi:hypothetical protein
MRAFERTKAMKTEYNVNDEVRVSDYVIRPIVDEMMQWTGGPQRARRKEWIRAELNKRGEILAVFDNGYAKGVRIKWRSGSVSETMMHRITHAENASQYDYLNA